MRDISETRGKKDWFVHEVETAERLPSTIRRAFLNLACGIDTMLDRRRDPLSDVYKRDDL